MSAVRITRARHPMAGQVLPVLAQRRVRGQLELLVVLPDGSKSLVPAAWTDLDDAVAEQEAQATPGQPLGSLADLLHASTLTRAVLARVRGPEQAARQSSYEEDNRAACAVESDAGPGPGASPDGDRAASRSAGRRRGRGAGRPDRPDRQPGSGAGRGRGGHQ